MAIQNFNLSINQEETLKWRQQKYQEKNSETEWCIEALKKMFKETDKELRLKEKIRFVLGDCKNDKR